MASVKAEHGTAVMAAASATLDFVVVVIPRHLCPHRASNSCTNNVTQRTAIRKERKRLLITFFRAFCCAEAKSFRLLLCRRCLRRRRRHRPDSTEPNRTAVWTVCLSSIINIRAWMRGGREFDGDGDGWRRLF